MSHVSLYRKYRPQTFDDVVGQQHITRTLRNALRDGTTAHAYLFCGPRGTGKTTTARLLAKALLCEKGPTPDPDDTCEQCVEVTEGRHPDVFEMDAASRTGVDDVREGIIARAPLGSSRGRVKVYIIDEVHMLSKPAFNALLKTLEEPPPHVFFVLCTTDPHKVIDTVQSRCQRFDFHRLGIAEIAGQLAKIAAAESIRVEEGSLLMIARHAAGGMRDAITIFEQLASFTGQSISLADVEGLLGEVDRALLFDLAGMIARRDAAGCFRFVAQLAESGVDMAEFVRELVAHYRDLYVTSIVGEPVGIVDATDEELALLAAQAREYGTDRLSRVLDVLGGLSAELRWSSDSRLSLEVALTRLARPQGDVTVEALAERLDLLESGTAASPPYVAPAPAPRPVTVPEPTPERVPAPAPVAAEAPAGPPAAMPDPAPATASQPAEAAAPAGPPPSGSVPARPLDRAQLRRAWPNVVAEIKRKKKARASWFVSVEVEVDADGETLRIEFPADQEITMSMADKPESVALLREALTHALGYAPPLKFQLGRGAARPPAPIELEADPAEILGGEIIDAPAAEPEEPVTPPAPAPEAPSLLDTLGAEEIAVVPHDAIEAPEEDEES